MATMSTIARLASERRIGFKMDEVMSGEHEFQPGHGPGERRPMSFRVTWGPTNLFKWLNPWGDEFLTQPLDGTVTVDGLCVDAPCSGTLALRYFTERKIRYDFRFSNAGRSFRFVGEKVNIWPWNLHVSHTTCYGELVDETSGELVSRSITFFRFRTAPAFIASLRLA
ncbi:MAG: hypothetical protein HYV63_34460 [Candidatus Schekmanbacteria bacterium]|nr:hypothetical protein [Candidatus Schekmanbacteria bacterium]